ncbi:MAG: serine hydrolase, partial [Brachybacterium sp.]
VFTLADGEQPLAGEVQIRLSLTTDTATRGLGAWVGRIRVLEGRRELLDTDRDADRDLVLAEGWSREG